VGGVRKETCASARGRADHTTPSACSSSQNFICRSSRVATRKHNEQRVTSAPMQLKNSFATATRTNARKKKEEGCGRFDLTIPVVPNPRRRVLSGAPKNRSGRRILLKTPPTLPLSFFDKVQVRFALPRKRVTLPSLTFLLPFLADRTFVFNGAKVPNSVFITTYKRRFYSIFTKNFYKLQIKIKTLQTKVCKL
jgi:hypothetical protein